MKNSTCLIDGCETKIRARGYCASHYAKLNRYGDPEHVPPRQAKIEAILLNREARCTKCNEVKRLEGFSRDKAKATGYRRVCKECSKEITDAWRSGNADHVSEYARAYRESNFEKIQAYRLAYLPAWKMENMDKVREYNHRRRAAKAGTARGPVDLGLLWEKSGGRCGLCAGELDKSRRWPDGGFVSVDHIHPLSRGGSHVQENLQYTHLACNLRKHAKVA